jgi:hypothetical protein
MLKPRARKRASRRRRPHTARSMLAALFAAFRIRDAQRERETVAPDRY